jgi:hypothetical protein
MINAKGNLNMMLIEQNAMSKIYRKEQWNA